MSKPQFKHTVKECICNGKRLLSDTNVLITFSDAISTAFAITIIAQEEFAKAYLLTLIYKNVIPWNKFTRRATRDHTCKQLLTMIMDHLNPDIDTLIARGSIPIEETLTRSLPDHVASAMDIFRHDKIRRWESRSWWWDEDPKYDSKAKKIANGKLEKLKQDQLYIDVSKNGSVITKNTISREQLEVEIDRAERLSSLISDMIDKDEIYYFDYKEITEAFKLLFSDTISDNKL